MLQFIFVYFHAHCSLCRYFPFFSILHDFFFILLCTKILIILILLVFVFYTIVAINKLLVVQIV